MALDEVDLHIEALKDKFCHYETITTDDFYEFYKEVFGEIKRKTLHWYVYELKERGVIRNLSRGIYTLREEEKVLSDHSANYLVITMDIINSTRSEDYNLFNRQLIEKTEAINRSIKLRFDSERKYHISQGDEIQILFPLNRHLGDLLMLSLSHLSPYEVRYGIGAGRIEGELKENSWEMNGPLFWNARDQINKLKKSRQYDGLIMTGHSQKDRICNKLMPLINKAIVRITAKQWEAIREDFTKVELSHTLEKLNISQASYYERLKASNLDEILMALMAVYEIVEPGGE
ncbi:MAG: SatD family protein [Spirochaetales bacterium]|nr:SatD family protein [Spirochaetales bacterium]